MHNQNEIITVLLVALSTHRLNPVKNIRTIRDTTCYQINKLMMMTDPKEKMPQEANDNENNIPQQPNENKETNWDTHQQVDEEGNELEPGDIK